VAMLPNLIREEKRGNKGVFRDRGRRMELNPQRGNPLFCLCTETTQPARPRGCEGKGVATSWTERGGRLALEAGAPSTLIQNRGRDQGKGKPKSLPPVVKPGREELLPDCK